MEEPMKFEVERPGSSWRSRPNQSLFIAIFTLPFFKSLPAEVDTKAEEGHVQPQGGIGA